MANAVCVTAHALRSLPRGYRATSSPQLSQWDEENPRLTALDANRLFDVAILQKCQVLYGKHVKLGFGSCTQDYDMLLIVKSALTYWKLELYALTLQYLS